MTSLREAATQALEALEHAPGYSMRRTDAITALRAALAEPTPLEDIVTHGNAWSKNGKRIDPMSVYAEPVQESVQESVWVCPDSAEHRYQKPGHCEDCGKTLVQVAEPVQEPVAWMYDFLNPDNREEAIRNWVTQNPVEIESEKGFNVRPLYTAPLQRKPLSDEDIEKAYRHIYRNLSYEFDHSIASWVEQGIRYAELAHGIGGSNE